MIDWQQWTHAQQSPVVLEEKHEMAVANADPDLKAVFLHADHASSPAYRDSACQAAANWF